MSKLTDSFRAVGVFNPYEFYGRGRVYLDFRPAHSRACVSSAWVVHCPGFKTDPGAHWQDNGNKTFLGRFRGEALADAQAWASERYGIKAWARDPYGGYGDAEFVAARVKELKAAVASVERPEESSA